MSPRAGVPPRAVTAIKDAMFALDALTHPDGGAPRTPITVSSEAVRYLDTWVRARLQVALRLLTAEPRQEDT